MTTLAADIAAWIADLARLVVTDEDDLAEIADRTEALPALSGTAYAGEALDLVQVIGESASDPAHFSAMVAGDGLTVAGASAVAQFLAAVTRAIAAPRIDWPSRPAAIAAREALTADCDVARAFAAFLGADLYTWFNALAAISARLVSELAATRAPVVIVETGISLPSTVLAYKLYGDPSRAAALCEVAGSATPLLMPARFEALGS